MKNTSLWPPWPYQIGLHNCGKINNNKKEWLGQSVLSTIQYSQQTSTKKDNEMKDGHVSCLKKYYSKLEHSALKKKQWPPTLTRMSP